MDLAVYINELLGLEGEVNVPGIGRFVHTRINGYYKEEENKFYPPSHKIDFDAEAQPDDRLAAFISDKKNISLASAKYFIDKYVNGLKQQIPVHDVDIAGLGQLYLNGSTTGFKEVPASKENDPAFFGLKPVDVAALAEKPPVQYTAPPINTPEEEQKTPSIADRSMTELVNDRIPPAPKPVVTEQPSVIEKPTVIEKTEEPAEEEYAYEEPSRNRKWIVILLILIIALLSLMGLYKYKPELFDRFKEKPQTFTAADSTAKQPANTSNTDSTKKAATRQDSLEKAQALVANNSSAVDTAAVEHYEVSGGAYKSLSTVNEIIKHYQDSGLHPRLLNHVKGKLYKITLGTYFNKEQGQKLVDSILAATKFRDIRLDTYKPKQ
jgi:hypothetical protein